MFNFFKTCLPAGRKKRKPENLKEVLTGIENIEKRIENISENLDCVKKMSQVSLQKIGVVRFNPFKDMGGDQSFSIALLDFENNGLVLSSIYSREGNRIYAKPVKGGGSEYSLSEEEKEALDKAIKFYGK